VGIVGKRFFLAPTAAAVAAFGKHYARISSVAVMLDFGEDAD
jgi:hypothetical protein